MQLQNFGYRLFVPTGGTKVIFYKIIFFIFSIISFCHRVWEIHLNGNNKGLIVGRWTSFGMIFAHLFFFLGSNFEILLKKDALNYAVTAIGIFLFIGSWLLRAWAVRTLGKYWSINNQIRRGHVLMTEGPYRHCRHPNYFSIILEMVGFCLIANAFITLAISLIIYMPILYMRIKVEEKTLLAVFGDKYERYMKSTPPLIPHKNAKRI